MKKYFLILLMALVSITFLFSCQRVDEEYKFDETIEQKGIPLEYGSLVSVTPQAEWPGWAQLWFEDDNNTIRMVRIEFHKGEIEEGVRTISRY